MGYFELNLMMPLIAYNSLQSIQLLARGVGSFSERCVEGLQADRERCEEMIEKSLALATPLAIRIGYDGAAQIAKKAFEARKTIRQVAEEEGILTKQEIDCLLDPFSMVSPAK